MVKRDSSTIYVRLADFATTVRVINLNSATETRQRRFVIHNDIQTLKWRQSDFIVAVIPIPLLRVQTSLVKLEDLNLVSRVA